MSKPLFDPIGYEERVVREAVRRSARPAMPSAKSNAGRGYNSHPGENATVLVVDGDDNVVTGNVFMLGIDELGSETCYFGQIPN